MQISINSFPRSHHPQLAQQFVASIHFVHKRHDLEVLGPGDKIRDTKQEHEEKEGMLALRFPFSGQMARLARLTHPVVTVDPLPADDFKAGLVELSRDLILKEQQIEVLISSLPGLENSEKDQERFIKDLEEELKLAESQRQDAVREKDQVLAKLDQVIRSIRRP